MPKKIDPLNKKNYTAVTAALCVIDVKAATNFYQKAFGFQKRGIMNGADGKPMHAELTMRSTTLMLGPEMPGMGARSARNVGASPTTLYLLVENVGTMDGFEWNNNTGFFSVAVTLERPDVSSRLFSVNSTVSFANFACMPNRSLCTPEREIVEERGNKQYHILLPAQSEWGASIANPAGATVIVRASSGTVCLTAGSCSGPQGIGKPAGADFLVPGKEIGALVNKTIGGRTYFSVNDRTGIAFQKHEGYFEFDAVVQ